VPVSAIPKNGDTPTEAERQRQWREIGLGAQILKDLDISSIRLLTSAEHRYVGLAGFGSRSWRPSRSGADGRRLGRRRRSESRRSPTSFDRDDRRRAAFARAAAVPP